MQRLTVKTGAAPVFPVHAIRSTQEVSALLLVLLIHEGKSRAAFKESCHFLLRRLRERRPGRTRWRVVGLLHNGRCDGFAVCALLLQQDGWGERAPGRK